MSLGLAGLAQIPEQEELAKPISPQMLNAVYEEMNGLRRQLQQAARDRDNYCGLFSMYRDAWIREMGGVINKKHHEIDGFVLRTRDVYNGFLQAESLRKEVAALKKKNEELEALLHECNQNIQS